MPEATPATPTTRSEPPPYVPEPVPLPKAVREAAARADRLMAEQNGPKPGDEPPAPPPSPDTPPAPVTEPSAPPPPPPPPPEPATASDWEQRYRTLQGKYDSETAGLRGQVANLERLLATMQNPPPAAPAAPAPAARGPVKYNDDDVQLYGEDMLQAATRAAEARYQPEIAELRAEITRLKSGHDNLAGQHLQDQVFDALDKDPELAGRWRPVNTSREFINWLQGVDEYSGLSRFDMLQHAYTNGDAIRTGRFFKKYMAEHTVQPPAPAHTALAPASQPNGNGHAAPAGGTRLEDFAAPGRAAAGSSSDSGGNGALRTWSRPEITAFYRDRTSGRYKGREEESQRLEADIIAAAREGRIQ